MLSVVILLPIERGHCGVRTVACFSYRVSLPMAVDSFVRRLFVPTNYPLRSLHRLEWGETGDGGGGDSVGSDGRGRNGERLTSVRRSSRALPYLLFFSPLARCVCLSTMCRRVYVSVVLCVYACT